VSIAVAISYLDPCRREDEQSARNRHCGCGSGFVSGFGFSFGGSFLGG
jgi:hypothetical protein